MAEYCSQCVKSILGTLQKKTEGVGCREQFARQIDTLNTGKKEGDWGAWLSS